MDVHLIGGGWDDTLAPTLYGEFVEAAARRAGTAPRILLVVMGTDAESLEYHERYVHTLGLVGGHELVVERVPEGSPFDEAALDGVPVCPEDSNEDLDAVAVVEGIGLVTGAVDVHAAQWGNVSRAVAVVAAGLAPNAVALDEGTRLGPAGRVAGTGRVWHVTPDTSSASGVLVRAQAAGQ
jgi:cyanophycinase